MIKNIRRFVRASSISAVAVGLALLVDPSAASAGTDTSNLSVSATVSANCTITTTAVSFGTYDPVSVNASSPLDASGGVTVNCTSGSAGYITLGQGSSAEPTSTDSAPLRQMASGLDRLKYALFQDTAGGIEWANTGTTGINHLGTGISTGITVYGRIAGGQNVPAGSYSDTVVATVTF